MSSGIDSNSKYNYLQRVQSFRGLYSQRGGCCRGPKTAFTEGGCRRGQALKAAFTEGGCRRVGRGVIAEG